MNLYSTAMHLCAAAFDWNIKLLIHEPHKRKEGLSARHITESWDHYPECHSSCSPDTAAQRPGKSDRSAYVRH